MISSSPLGLFVCVLSLRRLANLRHLRRKLYLSQEKMRKEVAFMDGHNHGPLWTAIQWLLWINLHVCFPSTLSGPSVRCCAKLELSLRWMWGRKRRLSQQWEAVCNKSSDSWGRHANTGWPKGTLKLLIHQMLLLQWEDSPAERAGIRGMKLPNTPREEEGYA